MTKPKRITAKYFKEATGMKPEQDDLERCNCPKAGEITHSMCGWDWRLNLPKFWCADVPLSSQSIGIEQ
jgi:hypothetical protein